MREVQLPNAAHADLGANGQTVGSELMRLPGTLGAEAEVREAWSSRGVGYCTRLIPSTLLARSVPDETAPEFTLSHLALIRAAFWVAEKVLYHRLLIRSGSLLCQRYRS